MKINLRFIPAACFNLSVLSFSLLASYSANAQSQKCFEETSNGVIAIEAEGFFSQEKTSKREWFVIGNGANTPKPDPDGSHAGDASGGRYIEVLPDTRVVGHSGPGPEDPLVRGENFSDKAGELAVLNYRVNFKTAGKYFVWARLYSSGPEDNSIHVGINNTWPKSGERMQWCVRRKWEWESKQRTKQEHCGVERQIFINVPSPGVHTFQISMREDGVEVDKIILSKAYNKPTGKGPAAKTGDCAATTTSSNSCDLPNITNKSSIAVVADGNSPDPDDIGATAVSLALLKAFGIEKDLVYYSHSCDLDPFSGSRQTINAREELNRQRLMQTSCDGTASRWGGYDGITFYNCRTQRKLATDKLKDAINAATSTKPLAIILAGEPDLIYDAINAAQSAKRRLVTIISHHIANEESADEAGKNISDLVKRFTTVKLVRIPDQNEKLKTKLATWHWARDHKDSRLNWLWQQGKIAEEDNVVGFQKGDFDCSDAGMLYFQITGNRAPGVREVRESLLCYIDGENSGAPNTNPTANSAPVISITSPADGATFTLGDVISLQANASDPDGNLDKVNFKINEDFFKTDNSRPFENSFTPTEAGTYIIGARAFDKDGLATERKVTIIVNEAVIPNREPEVAISSPKNNETFQLGEEITLSANASDPDGNLDRVNFKINETFFKTDNQRPFTNVFTPDSPGTYKIAARAFDKDGLSFESFVTITVEVVLSTESFLNPNSTQRVKLYPSPTVNTLNIEGLTNNNTPVSIVDISGKIVLNTVVSKGNPEISVSNLAKGMYFFKINNNSNQKTISFIKN